MPRPDCTQMIQKHKQGRYINLFVGSCQTWTRLTFAITTFFNLTTAAFKSYNWSYVGPYFRRSIKSTDGIVIYTYNTNLELVCLDVCMIKYLYYKEF